MIKEGIAAMIAVASFGISTAYASPTMEITYLPIGGDAGVQFRADAKARGLNDDQINQLYKTIGSIEVYNDHQNADSSRNDSSINKKFYATPNFHPSAVGLVGAEQFSDYAMQIVDSVDQLLASFHFKSREYLRLTSQLEAVVKKIADVDAILAKDTTPEDTRNSLTQLRTILVAEKGSIEEKLTALRSEGGNGAAQLGEALRKDICSDVITQIARIGVSPSQEEMDKINSTDTLVMAQGLADLRARAGGGQFGIRQVVFESGFTEEQRNALDLYLELRKDVKLYDLNVSKVYARAAAQTLLDENDQPDTRSAPMIIRAINGGPNRGDCGNVHSCNVVIEYTNMGARDARFAKGLGNAVVPVLVPVTFQADVTVAEPDFVGRFDCNLVTGWQAIGRADVKDGAIIYDGDVTDGINYSTIDSGSGCSVTIQEGSQDCIRSSIRVLTRARASAK